MDNIGRVTFMSGETSDRFSPVSDDTLVEAVRELNERKVDANRYQSSIDQLQQTIEELRMMDNAGMTKIDQVDTKLEMLWDMVQATWIIYKSPLFRFLNALGGWYIYGDDGNIYPNTSYYRTCGNPPLVTRLKEGFREAFLKIKMKIASIVSKKPN